MTVLYILLCFQTLVSDHLTDSLLSTFCMHYNTQIPANPLLSPPPAGGEGLFFQTLLRGGGGGLKERGAYLIQRNASMATRFVKDVLVVTGHYNCFF